MKLSQPNFSAIKTSAFKSQFIPARKKSKKLMIVLHGRGDSLRPFKQFNDEMKVAKMNYLLLNAPRKYLSGFSWYGEPPFQKNGVLKARQKLFALLEELEAQGWKSKDIFLFGFSQGCLISADIALNYPKPLGGVVGISGYFHFFPQWRKHLPKKAVKTPWLMTHGYRDDVLSIDETRFGVGKLKEAGLDVEWVELDKKHTLEEDEYPIIRRWVREKLKS